MAINQDTVLRVAHLARLQVTDQDCAELSTRLSDILAMVDELQQADVSDAAPMAHPLDVQQPQREDKITETDIRDLVMPLAPAAENGCYLVPRVIE
ncbi:MAG: Asp-tRNA(Asn)/Glu-tRNA(Gln) amidotransferase subunit GatC [Alcanivoracaceae bacterium]|nr:Asp-tRNA(Asn)/Glu-tRNA(Gln) amidotransferase subunit GatC [Alcanivoracaceae bacterium]